MASKRKVLEYASLQRTCPDEPDFTFDVLLVGDSGVGKSALLDMFTEERFSEESVTTIGIDLKVRTIEVDGKIIRLMIWDTCGQEKFRSVIPSYYRKCHGVMVVYDVSDKVAVTRVLVNMKDMCANKPNCLVMCATYDNNSFDQLKMWLIDINKYAPENVSKILVGNKCDLPNLVVNISTAKRFAEEQKIPFLETSVKKGINVNLAFMKLAKHVMNNHDLLKSLQQKKLTIGNGSTQTKKGGKCC